MSLADRIAEAAQVAPKVVAARQSAPTGWEPGVRYDPATALPSEVTTEQVAQDVQGSPEAWRGLVAHLLPMIPAGHELRLVEARYDPLAWSRETTSTEAKTQATTRPAWRYRFRVVSVDQIAGATVDLAAVTKVAKANRRNRNPILGTGRTRVVVLADAQVGKVDHRGGTAELIERVDAVIGRLEDLAKSEPCDDLVVLDPGDLTEGFENTAQQQHTNDLSFPRQLDTAAVILTHAVTSLAARHGSTRVATVPSNHGAWRRGKDRLGRPGDDFGLYIHTTVARQLAARDDITFVIPDPWAESLAVKVRGAVLGLVHGHQVTQPNGFPGWWAKQTHGDMPLAAATIAVTGHFHHLRVEPSGALAGRSRWWMQAPTLDNGSSWWANGGGGSDGEAGALTFTIDDSGRWDHLRLVTA